MRFWQALSHTEPEQIVEVARIAEAVGFHGVVASDHLFYPEKMASAYPYSEDGKPGFAKDTPWLEPGALLAAIGGATRTLWLSHAVMILPLRHPLEVAKSLATVSRIAGGRVALGAGVGWMKEEFDQLGRDFHTRGRRTDEMIEVMRKLWASGGPVEHHGRFFDFDPIWMHPTPSAPIPVWIGGQSEPALRRAARLGDGWIASGCDVSEIEVWTRRLDALRREAGRSQMPFSVLVPLASLPTLEDARRCADLDVDAVLWPLAFQLGNPSSSLDDKRRALEDFADRVIARVG
jgi:probable F420-dependent oxidoreductase